MRSSEVIVPLVLAFVPVRSVVDVGCGDGSWLAVFRRYGVEEILGLDGDYVDREALQIPPESFQACDLRNPLEIRREFDLAVSLEVAEHLPEPCAAMFIEGLVQLAPAVLFSAAIPFQGGTNHINEQWPDKWAELFKRHGYVAVDMIRKQVWRNETVDWWYAQNTILFVHPRLLEANAALKREFERTNPGQLSLVHPRKYLELATPPTPTATSWGVKGAFLILISSLRSAVKRRFSSISG
jgi:SAM-dependent methyltransferase